MSRIVQKYGGTSVGTPERIVRVARRVARERAAGHEVVVVVSAMAHTTDELTALAARVTPDPRRAHPRELDMLLTAGERISMALLAMAIRDAGVEAISLTGSQAAIITDTGHTGARIEEIRADRVRAELAAGRVVIVAGFQGVSRTREVTTLGRGGSDTTAVALAAALPAARCDIFTDVDGVFTADPRRVPAARRLARVGYEEMVELASSGAQVMHPRAVELGARYRVPIRILSSFREAGGGTLIVRKERGVEERGMEELALTGLASTGGQARLAVTGLPARMDTTTEIVGRLAAAGVSVDMLSQVDDADGRRAVQVTLAEEDLATARPLCESLVRELGGAAVLERTGLARIALVGSGMHGRPGVFSRTFRALAEADVDVCAVSASAISIAVLVPESAVEQALRVLHDAFTLESAGEAV
jgi:aspartate kinase